MRRSTVNPAEQNKEDETVRQKNRQPSILDTGKSNAGKNGKSGDFRVHAVTKKGHRITISHRCKPEIGIRPEEKVSPHLILGECDYVVGGESVHCVEVQRTRKDHHTNARKFSSFQQEEGKPTDIEHRRPGPCWFNYLPTLYQHFKKHPEGFSLPMIGSDSTNETMYFRLP